MFATLNYYYLFVIGLTTMFYLESYPMLIDTLYIFYVVNFKRKTELVGTCRNW